MARNEFLKPGDDVKVGVARFGAAAHFFIALRGAASHCVAYFFPGRILSVV